MPVNMEPETYHDIVENANSDKAAGTRRNYRCQWRRWVLFSDQQGYTPAPGNPLSVAHYLLTLRDMGRATTSMQAILPAIADGHKRRGLDDPTRHPIVRKTLASIKQARKEAGKPGPKQARGLTAERLERIRKTAYTPRKAPGGFMESPERARQRADREIAILSVMRDALLRQGEAAKLRWSDVTDTDDGGALIRVRTSKTSAEAAHLYVRRRAAEALRKIRPEDPDPEARVFGFKRNESIANLVARCTAPPDSGTGTRATRCASAWPRTSRQRAPASRGSLQAGRWASAATVSRYIERLQPQRGAVASLPEVE